MAGRPIKLNDELTERICANLKLGLPYNLVCKSVGIHYDTFNDWAKKGREGNEEIYVNFLQAVEAAEMDCAIESMKCIKEYAKTTLQAACWYMEHRFSSEFSKNTKVELDNRHRGQIKIESRQEDCGQDTD